VEVKQIEIQGTKSPFYRAKDVKIGRRIVNSKNDWHTSTIETLEIRENACGESAVHMDDVKALSVKSFHRADDC